VVIQSSWTRIRLLPKQIQLMALSFRPGLLPSVSIRSVALEACQNM
jgi:hypothetical protein